MSNIFGQLDINNENMRPHNEFIDNNNRNRNRNCNRSTSRSRSSAFYEQELNINENIPRVSTPSLLEYESVTNSFFRVVKGFLTDISVYSYIIFEVPGIISRIPGKSDTNVMKGFVATIKSDDNNNYTKFIIKNLIKKQIPDIDTVSREIFFNRIFGLSEEQVDRKLIKLHAYNIENGIRLQAFVQNSGRLFSYLKYFYKYDNNFLEWTDTLDKILKNSDGSSEYMFGVMTEKGMESIRPNDFIEIDSTKKPEYVQDSNFYPILDNEDSFRKILELFLRTNMLKKMFMARQVTNISDRVRNFIEKTPEFSSFPLPLKLLVRTFSPNTMPHTTKPMSYQRMRLAAKRSSPITRKNKGKMGGAKKKRTTKRREKN